MRNLTEAAEDPGTYGWRVTDGISGFGEGTNREENEALCKMSTEVWNHKYQRKETVHLPQQMVGFR